MNAVDSARTATRVGLSNAVSCARTEELTVAILQTDINSSLTQSDK